MNGTSPRWRRGVPRPAAVFKARWCCAARGIAAQFTARLSRHFCRHGTRPGVRERGSAPRSMVSRPGPCGRRTGTPPCRGRPTASSTMCGRPGMVLFVRVPAAGWRWIGPRCGHRRACLEGHDVGQFRRRQSSRPWRWRSQAGPSDRGFPVGRSRRCALPTTAFFETPRRRPISAVECPSSQSWRSLATVSSFQSLPLLVVRIGVSCCCSRLQDPFSASAGGAPGKGAAWRPARPLRGVAPAGTCRLPSSHSTFGMALDCSGRSWTRCARCQQGASHFHHGGPGDKIVQRLCHVRCVLDQAHVRLRRWADGAEIDPADDAGDVTGVGFDLMRVAGADLGAQRTPRSRRVHRSLLRMIAVAVGC